VGGGADGVGGVDEGDGPGGVDEANGACGPGATGPNPPVDGPDSAGGGPNDMLPPR
jgi:hypothetical protein